MFKGVCVCVCVNTNKLYHTLWLILLLLHACMSVWSCFPASISCRAWHTVRECWAWSLRPHGQPPPPPTYRFNNTHGTCIIPPDKILRSKMFFHALMVQRLKMVDSLPWAINYECVCLLACLPVSITMLYNLCVCMWMPVLCSHSVCYWFSVSVVPILNYDSECVWLYICLPTYVMQFVCVRVHVVLMHVLCSHSVCHGEFAGMSVVLILCVFAGLSVFWLLCVCVCVCLLYISVIASVEVRWHIVLSR
jgi:hypothetical protein